MKHWFLAGWQLVLFLLWGVWWGGLCFYAVVVVPIGTEMIGSVEQGFITQQVTQWHNAVLTLFVLALWVEWYRCRRRSLIVTGTTLAIIDIALIAWHAHLTSLMNIPDHTVPREFYAQHALYLWLTAAEWATGIASPLFLWPHQFQLANNSNESPIAKTH